MIIRDTIQLQLKVNKDLSTDTSCILSQPWETRSQRPEHTKDPPKQKWVSNITLEQRGSEF